MSRMPVDTTITPSRDEFLRLAATHTLVPVYRTVTADLETPVSAFLRLASDEPQSFLLESVEGGEKVGRYTFIGVRPYRTILARGRSVVIRERVVVGEPLPPTVVLRPVPNYTEYRYAVVNDRRVIVEPRTRRVVKIID